MPKLCILGMRPQFFLKCWTHSNGIKSGARSRVSCLDNSAVHKLQLLCLCSVYVLLPQHACYTAIRTKSYRLHHPNKNANVEMCSIFLFMVFAWKNLKNLDGWVTPFPWFWRVFTWETCAAWHMSGLLVPQVLFWAPCMHRAPTLQLQAYSNQKITSLFRSLVTKINDGPRETTQLLWVPKHVFLIFEKPALRTFEFTKFLNTLARQT